MSEKSDYPITDKNGVTTWTEINWLDYCSFIEEDDFIDELLMLEEGN